MDDIAPGSEEEYEERKKELMEDAAETKAELEEEQDELLEELAEEHSAELVETPVNLVGDHTATIHQELHGGFINRMARIEESVEAYQSAEKESVRDIERVIDEACEMLATMLKEEEYSKKFFYRVYQETDPKAIGALLKKSGEAIEEERERKAGVAEGFRKRPED